MPNKVFVKRTGIFYSPGLARLSFTPMLPDVILIFTNAYLRFGAFNSLQKAANFQLQAWNAVQFTEVQF